MAIVRSTLCDILYRLWDVVNPSHNDSFIDTLKVLQIDMKYKDDRLR